MKLLQLVAVGECRLQTIEQLGPALSERLRVPWDVVPEPLKVDKTFHAERRQYHSTEILGGLQKLATQECWRMLGVTDLDLYIPILTFVFGEAQMGGSVALVSTHRLRQEFYGLPADEPLFHERLLKESLHELGHTLDLRHCHDYRCAMAASHAVEWIDVKETAICSECCSRARWPEPAEKKRLWPF